MPKNADVTMFCHSLIDPNNIATPFVGLHVIRDPRDIIVSGYQYHCRTVEKWCTNSNPSLESPIMFPNVPYPLQHQPEESKIKYLESLGGMSYREKLLSMSQRDGLLFEMNNYAAWTIDAMRGWNYSMDNILEIKFEQLMSDYNNTFRQIFEHLGFSKSKIELGISIASEHNLGTQSAESIRKIKHVTSTKFSRWRDHFEDVHKETFINKFGNVLVDLGYEESNDW